MTCQGKNIIWSDYLIREIYLSGNALIYTRWQLKNFFLALGGFQKWISLTDLQIRAKLMYDLLVIMLQKSLMPISISNEKKKLFYLPSTYYIPWNKYSLSIYNAMVTQWSILTKKQQLLLKPNTNIPNIKNS